MELTPVQVPVESLDADHLSRLRPGNRGWVARHAFMWDLSGTLWVRGDYPVTSVTGVQVGRTDDGRLVIDSGDVSRLVGSGSPGPVDHAVRCWKAEQVFTLQGSTST